MVKLGSIPTTSEGIYAMEKQVNTIVANATTKTPLTKTERIVANRLSIPFNSLQKEIKSSLTKTITNYLDKCIEVKKDTGLIKPNNEFRDTMLIDLHNVFGIDHTLVSNKMLTMAILTATNGKFKTVDVKTKTRSFGKAYSITAFIKAIEGALLGSYSKVGA